MTKTIKHLAIILTATLFLGACSGLSNTQQRVLSGGAIGTGVGVVGTAVTGGCVTCGAVIGGAVGAGAGYLVDQHEKGKLP
ncbi:hypothetical protein [uncultured Kiloniella sp.]|uniref:hypothetical protein n=1 Tax=Kiloniella sp. TaxID=1938587 RepID=UPI002629E6AC|nr:hypothetical protein [uncultured Kiloniella sp.]